MLSVCSWGDTLGAITIQNHHEKNAVWKPEEKKSRPLKLRALFNFSEELDKKMSVKLII